ncbi:hypothetical protein [Arsenophonus endosymbiont of Aleurodicus floccissimus]|uniref:hypothetical protein n=1 Tax=Arsenophonus endosymbiont of Aleurodicus floccissimus TaxID=2152761 RepID=UPI000E6B0323|nr:hypothetical protein [Arsenophonus endosymbiont of Aleurodicus floccissimus]
MKILFSSILILYSFGYTTSVFAKYNAVAKLIEINGRDIIVDNNTPVGTLLWNFTSGPYQTYSCDNNTANNMTSGGKVYGEFVTNIDNVRVYKTNIAEIGYAFSVHLMCGDMYYPSKGWIDNLDATSTCWSSGIWDPITHKFSIRIYKIGPTSNGYVSTRRVGASRLFYDNTKVGQKKIRFFKILLRLVS